MADFDDLNFDRGPASEPPPPLPPPPDGPPVLPIVAGAVLVAALGAILYLGLRGTPPAPEKTSPTVAQTTVNLPRPPERPAAEPGDPIDLPPLDQTDAVVRTLVGKLSSHPMVAAWLTTDGLIRNGVVVVSNIADGETPARQLRPLKPSGSFVTRTSGGTTVIDPSSYSRYDAIAAAVDGLDARGVAHLYATLKPRITDAYHDLIGPDADFDRTLERAIVVLLRTPIVDGDVPVRSVKLTYAYANPALEVLPAAQRQFLRMGPRNVRLVKAKLRAIAGFLGIPDSELPVADSAAPDK
jgi:Protein of unknown function (DUF3014)